MAKKETERLFSLLSLENPNQDELEKIYPNYSKIGQRLLLKEIVGNGSKFLNFIEMIKSQLKKQ